jgi:hypothetical protein
LINHHSSIGEGRFCLGARRTQPQFSETGDTGRTVLGGPAAELARDPEVQRIYLGLAATH